MTAGEEYGHVVRITVPTPLPDWPAPESARLAEWMREDDERRARLMLAGRQRLELRRRRQ